MKSLALILFLLTSNVWSQEIYTNRPDLIDPLLEELKRESIDRDIEITERLSRVDSIIVLEQPMNKGGKPSISGFKSDGITWTRGYTIWIHLKRSRMEEHKGSQLRLFYHEIGHAMGLEDCFQCRYNIMRGQVSERANFLFRDSDLARIYIDEFFEAIRDPEGYNLKHKHY
jgi:hypothetical protein